jgi:hypothetical protein
LKKPLTLYGTRVWYVNYQKWKFHPIYLNLLAHLFRKENSRVSVEGEMSTLRDMEAGVPQDFILFLTLYNLYINDIPQTAGVNLALVADDTSLYVTEHREGYVLRKLLSGLKSMTDWCKQWNI